MENQPKEGLHIGRAAFAKAFCSDWLYEHRKTLFLSLLTLVVLSTTLIQLTSRFGRSGYLEVQRAFTLWISKDAQDPQLLKNLEKPLSRHPELQAKFGTQIAQRLLSVGDASKAKLYASAALKRSHELTSPYYSQFSCNSLMISQGKYEEALTEAQRLKSAMEGDDPFWEGRDKMIKSGSVLYAYNLLRIASLQQQLGSKEGELKAWEELVANAGWKDKPSNLKTYDPEAYALLAQNFTQGDVSLLDFIEQRRKELIVQR